MCHMRSNKENCLIILLLPNHNCNNPCLLPLPPTHMNTSVHAYTHAHAHTHMHAYTIQLLPECPLYQTHAPKKHTDTHPPPTHPSMLHTHTQVPVTIHQKALCRRCAFSLALKVWRESEALMSASSKVQMIRPSKVLKFAFRILKSFG